MPDLWAAARKHGEALEAELGRVQAQGGGMATITAAELARALCVCVKTVRRWSSDGRMPAPLKFGRLRRWTVAELRGWLVEVRAGRWKRGAAWK